MNNETCYQENCKLSRTLCNQMERLLHKTQYDIWLMRGDNMYKNNLEILRLQKELDKLWEIQMTLIEKPFYTKVIKPEIIERGAYRPRIKKPLTIPKNKLILTF